MPENPPKAYQVTCKKNIATSEGFIANDNTLGSYIHLHFASNPQVAVNFVESCAAYSSAEDI